MFFCQTNVFTIEVTREMISRKFLSVLSFHKMLGVKFRGFNNYRNYSDFMANHFHECMYQLQAQFTVWKRQKFTLTFKNFRQINLQSFHYGKSCFHGNFAKTRKFTLIEDIS